MISLTPDTGSHVPRRGCLRCGLPGVSRWCVRCGPEDMPSAVDLATTAPHAVGERDSEKSRVRTWRKP